MKKFTTLVCLDFSKSSYIVLEKALDFTQKMGGELHVVHVVESSFFSKKIDIEDLKEKSFSKLSKTFGFIKKENFHCVVGKIKVEVANTASILDADMIIMGKSGETYFLNDLFMGSHTKEIIKYAQTTSLVIKSEHEIKYDNILVLSDLSNESANAIQKIVKYFPDSKIQLLNLFYLPLDNRINTYGFSEEDVQEYQENIKKESQDKIESFLASLLLPKETIITATALNSSLNPKLFNNEVREIGFDLLAIHATQNVSFFAFDILEQAEVDVLVVK